MVSKSRGSERFHGRNRARIGCIAGAVLIALTPPAISAVRC